MSSEVILLQRPYISLISQILLILRQEIIVATVALCNIKLYNATDRFLVVRNNKITAIYTENLKQVLDKHLDVQMKSHLLRRDRPVIVKQMIVTF